jgi:hypothetical protein
MGKGLCGFKPASVSSRRQAHDEGPDRDISWGLNWPRPFQPLIKKVYSPIFEYHVFGRIRWRNSGVMTFLIFLYAGK